MGVLWKVARPDWRMHSVSRPDQKLVKLDNNLLGPSGHYRAKFLN